MTDVLAIARKRYWDFLLAWFLVVFGGIFGAKLWFECTGAGSLKAISMLRATIIICLGYLFYPGWQFRSSRLHPLLWSFMLAFAYFGIAFWVDDKCVFSASDIKAALAVFLMSLAIHSVVISLSAVFDRNRLVPLYGLWILALFTTLPMWLAPWVDAIGPSITELSAILCSSPLSYLAAMLDYDVLRQQWFYQHLPYGAYRYDYPDKIYFSMSLLLIAFIALANPKLGKAI